METVEKFLCLKDLVMKTGERELTEGRLYNTAGGGIEHGENTNLEDYKAFEVRPFYSSWPSTKPAGVTIRILGDPSTEQYGDPAFCRHYSDERELSPQEKAFAEKQAALEAQEIEKPKAVFPSLAFKEIKCFPSMLGGDHGGKHEED